MGETTDIKTVVADLLHRGDSKQLDAVLEPLHPADIADLFEYLENVDKVRLLKRLGNERAAEVLTAVDEHSGQALLELLTDDEVISLLEEMPSDDAVDLISSLPPEKSRQIGALLSSAERARLGGLLAFEEDTAGGIMEVEKAAVRATATIRDAIELVRKLADDIENLQNVFVVDHAGMLIGSIPVLDLLLHEPLEKVTDVMQERPISVPVTMDQEAVASLFGKYDVFSLPVVDAAGRLVGRITVDDIIDVMEEEASEDIARIAGTDEEEFGEKSALRISRARMPWLVVAMVGEIVNAMNMSRYEVSIQTMVTLAFFVPLVIGIAGTTGMQAAVVVVREIAVGQGSAGRVWKRVLREFEVTLINGLVLGTILFGIVTAWRHEPGLGLFLWSTLLAVTVIAAFLGATVPIALHRLRIDPAISMGPFISVTSDIVGLMVYMTFANYYLSLIR
jgi:magnesium transporter